MNNDRSQAVEATDFEHFQETISVRFSDPSFLKMALTHRSHAFEQGGTPHNERLEFLGDAVLGLIVTDLIFEWFPDLPEGEMAKLRASTVNMAVLADAARAIGLGQQLLLGKGEDLSGGRDKPSILGDAFEALLGAVYLDSGIDAARQIVETLFTSHIKDHVERGVVRDFKTTLQEEAARLFGEHPVYEITPSGPDHAKRFSARVFLGGRHLGEGGGRSKKEAEQAAAKEALAVLEGSDA
ncbi:MAG: ribonuclease III [Actinobacteria bacterium]|nr:ribonuclease III [Actinomycetota bacterium]